MTSALRLVATLLDSPRHHGILRAVTVLSKNASIEDLGLAPGVHHLKVVVSGDTVAFELEDSTPPRGKTGFVRSWAGSSRKVEDPGDSWLAHINEKHLKP